MCIHYRSVTRGASPPSTAALDEAFPRTERAKGELLDNFAVSKAALGEIAYPAYDTHPPEQVAVAEERLADEKRKCDLFPRQTKKA
jgi:hypothetical protein